MAGLSQEEKAKKAEEATKRKLEENGKAEDGAAIQGTTPETDSEKEVGKTENEKEFIITVNGNQEYCGVGAGGIQFANGQAVTKSRRMASWFREHKGYTVLER